MAILNKDINMVKLLLDLGADANIPDDVRLMFLRFPLS
jgi:hypothetical protein